MRAAHGIACGLALLLGVAAGGARAHADEDTGDPAAFEKGLEKVERCLERERFEKGLKELGRLLAKHERKAYVLARVAEIEDLARRLAFRAEAEVPDPDDLLSGDLVSWSAVSGKIKLVYTPETAQDFDKAHGMLLHPAQFVGPYRILISGRNYPPSPRQSPRALVVGGEHPRTKKVQAWRITFGTPPQEEGTRKVWLPASVTHFDGKEEKEIGGEEVSPARPDKPFKLLVIVDRSKLAGYVNSKLIARASKSRSLYGRVAFDCKGWAKVELSGVIEPSWLQSKVDAALAADLAAFDKAYDRTQVLPAWLFEAPAEAPTTEAPEEPDEWPVALDRKHRGYVRLAQAARLVGKPEDGLEALAKLRAADAPQVLCAYLEAGLRADLGELDRALALAEQTVELAPDFVDGHLLQAEVLRRLGREAAFAAALLAATECAGASAHAYEAATITLLRAGLTAEARAVTQRAAGKGVRSELLGTLAGALVKAEKGPRWAQRFEHASENYRVVSDIDERTCREAAKSLEEHLMAYRMGFGWLPRDDRKFEVYLFSGQQGFLAYQQDLAGLMGKPSEKAAGLYHPLLKQLLIWNLPRRDAMMETIRHEGFHQYLDRFMADAPTWFNEGFAVYHENGKRQRGSLHFGQLHPEYIELLKEDGLVPLAVFLHVPHRKFYEGGHRSYAQAWALVHMMRHGEGKHRQLLKDLLKELESGDAEAAVRKVLPKAALAELDADLEQYVAALK